MKILDIIAHETGGERQYNDKYEIKANGTHGKHRKTNKPQPQDWRVEFESENFVIVEAVTQHEAERLAEQFRPDETVWDSMLLEDYERNYCN